MLWSGLPRLAGYRVRFRIRLDKCENLIVFPVQTITLYYSDNDSNETYLFIEDKTTLFLLQ